MNWTKRHPGWTMFGAMVGLLFFLPTLVGIGNLVMCIIGGLKANNGETYRYPFALRLIK